MIDIVPATLEHARDLAPRLRPADVAEIEAASGRDGEHALSEAIERGVWSEALVLDGKVEAIGGLGAVSLLFGPGIPWLLGSSKMVERARWFLAESRRQVARMLEHYGQLQNQVDARNLASIRYLKRLGFTIEPPAPWGVAGLPFHLFHLERP